MAAGDGDRKRRRTGKAPAVEAALVKWIDKARSCNVPLSGRLVRVKAEELAASLGEDNFRVSVGWFERFKKRENIVLRKVTKDANEAVSRDDWLEDQWEQMRQDYTEENIWSANESVIYFRAVPEGTMSFNSDSDRRLNRCEERVTALFACSAAGEKKELFVIGKSQNPRCFRNVPTLPVQYAASTSACMTGNLFLDWLKEWDHKLDQEGRDILLLLDRCAAHDVRYTILRNIRVEFLPENLHPCEQGVIRAAKAHYRREVSRSVLQQTDEGSRVTGDVSLVDALLMLRDAWADVEEPTIRNSWRRAGLLMSPPEEEQTGVDPPAEISSEQFERWIDTDDSVPVTDEDIIAEVRERFGMGNEEEEEKEETTVPSPAEMRNALSILKTGLLHAGFNKFDLLHQFAKEVNSVLDKTKL